MRSLRSFLMRLGGLFGKEGRARDFASELESHLEMHVEDNLRAGMTLEQARRGALMKLGGIEQAKELHRERRILPWMDALWQDVRFGVRMLAKNSGLTSVAVLTLALGIGANTAIFSLLDAVMLRFLPVQNPQELVRLKIHKKQRDNTSFSNPLWEQIRDHQDIFSGTFSWSGEQFDLAHGGAVQLADGMYVSGSYFSALAVRPAAGTLFTPADDRRGCAAQAVLSYGFWRDHFAGAPSAVGSTLSLNNHPFQIIGVSAPGFTGIDVGAKFDVAIPICATTVFDSKDPRLDGRSWWWLNIVGRVKTGVSPTQLKTRLETLSPQIFAGAIPEDIIEPQDRQEFLSRLLVSVPAATGTTGLQDQVGQQFTLLMAVVAIVLLIACANIASLTFARSAARNKEIAVRKALGASRGRLIRQLLTECLLLSAGGALVGILFAQWGSLLLVHYISTAQNKVFLDLSPDARVLGFTALVAIFAGLAVGILPALRSSRVSLTSAMKGGQAEDAVARIRFRPGKWMVASQVALSLVLLVVAGLFLRSLVKLTTLEIGFDRSNVMVVSANVKAAGIPAEQRLAAYDDAENRLRAIPGVLSVSRSLRTPISNYEWVDQVILDSPKAPKGDDALAYLNSVSPSYFQTLRTPLLAGREFNATDTKTSAPVSIVNETFARRFFPNANPVGKYFRKGAERGKPMPLIQIVGLVKDAKYDSLREDTYAQAFSPASQISEYDEAEIFEVRASQRFSTLIPSVQAAFAGVNKGISLDFSSLAEQVDDSLVQERLLATLSAFFGGLALLLAMIGLYGALSYLVNQRRTEFGIRMVLGAPPASILQLVMRDVAVILAGGILAGVVIALVSAQLLQTLLFGLSPHDPVTMIGAIALLTAVALCAGYLPARRAMRVDPMVALRYE